MAWRQNDTLDDAIITAARKAGASFRERLAVRICLLLPRKRQELELAMTEHAVLTGAINPEGDMICEGAYVGNWQDLFNWILENWPRIMEMIMQIIALFAAVAPMMITGCILGQCSGGICEAPRFATPVRAAVSHVIHEQPVRQTVRRIRAHRPVRRALDRIVFWR